MSDETRLGVQFANALAQKDFTRINDLLHGEIDFKGLTPGRNWEASDAHTVVTQILTAWFEESDDIRAVDSIETGSFADRERVGYRFRVRNPEGDFVVEQQAYISERDGQIGWMRVVCSGFRPIESSE